jgi:hypothetical protein
MNKPHGIGIRDIVMVKIFKLFCKKTQTKHK